MTTFPGLPNPEVCTTEKLMLAADYWMCMVEKPDNCLYVVKIGNIGICSIASKRGTALKRRIEDRKITVRYADNTLGVISRVKLDELIESGRIAAFERSSGWVDVANGPIRSKSSRWQFKGLQRRAGGQIPSHS